MRIKHGLRLGGAGRVIALNAGFQRCDLIRTERRAEVVRRVDQPLGGGEKGLGFDLCPQYQIHHAETGQEEEMSFHAHSNVCWQQRLTESSHTTTSTIALIISSAPARRQRMTLGPRCCSALTNQ